MMKSKGRSLYSEEDILLKLKMLPPELQALFFHEMEKIRADESEYAVEIIEECRQELHRNNAPSPNSSWSALNNSNASLTSLRLHGRSSSLKGSQPNNNYTRNPESEKEAIEKYLRESGRHPNYRATSSTEGGYARPVTAGSERSYFVQERPTTARRMRLDVRPSSEEWLPADIETKTNLSQEAKPQAAAQLASRVSSAIDRKAIEREQEILIDEMRSQEERMMTEKQRQSSIVRKKKEERKAKNLEMASELLDRIQEIDELKRQDRQRQDELVLKRLEKKKTTKTKEFGDMRMSSITQDDWQVDEHRRRSIRLESIDGTELKGDHLYQHRNNNKVSEFIDEDENESSHKSRESIRRSNTYKRAQSQPRNRGEDLEASEYDRTSNHEPSWTSRVNELLNTDGRFRDHLDGSQVANPRNAGRAESKF